MKNQDIWQPSKYVYRKRKLVSSRDRKEVSVGSRLMADLIAGFYDKNLHQYARGKLLDLGCGKVPLFIAYREYVTDNICVDWENTTHKAEYLDFEFDLTKVLPFVDEEFDTIILSDVLEHIPQPEHLWKEMARILSIDGKIIERGKDLRYGHIHEIEQSDLIVWIKKQVTKPLDISLKRD